MDIAEAADPGLVTGSSVRRWQVEAYRRMPARADGPTARRSSSDRGSGQGPELSAGVRETRETAVRRSSRLWWRADCRVPSSRRPAPAGRCCPGPDPGVTAAIGYGLGMLAAWIWRASGCLRRLSSAAAIMVSARRDAVIREATPAPGAGTCARAGRGRSPLGGRPLPSSRPADSQLCPDTATRLACRLALRSRAAHCRAQGAGPDVQLRRWGSWTCRLSKADRRSKALARFS